MEISKEERKRSRSESSSSDSERKRTKHHKKEKKEKKEKKHKKEKKKHKKHKKEKSDHFTKISSADYYKKSAEFRDWLLESKKIFAEDLKTDEAKRIFDDEFVEIWNSKKLSEKYYEGIPLEKQDPSVRTKYKWSFATKLDEKQIENLKEEIYRSTNSKNKSSNSKSEKKEESESDENIGPKNPNAAEEDDMDEEDKEAYKIWLAKRDKKDFKKKKESVIDELVPKKTGREAMFEKKKQKSEYTRVKKDETDFELKDSDIYGTGSDIKAKITKQKEFAEKKLLAKSEERSKKLDEYQKKENERLAPFLALVKSGAPIPLMQHRQNPPNQ